MDALDALDDVERFSVVAEQCSGKGSSSGWMKRTRSEGQLVAVDDAMSDASISTPITTKSKRRRPHSEAPTEIGASPVTNGNEPVICRGCARTEASPSFVHGDATVEWSFGGRGRWCSDCHTTWRTCYGHLGSLMTFNIWLSHLPNEQEFQMKLTAYISFLREGMSRISRAHIDGRVEVLRWAFDFWGLPFGLARVHLLGPPTSPPTVDPASFVQVVMPDGTPRVGHFKPVSNADAGQCMKDGATMLRRSQHTSAHWLSALNIQAIDGQDVAHVKAIMDADLDSEIVATTDMQGAKSDVVAVPFQKIIPAIVTAQRMVQATFGTSAWHATAKESHFTPLIAKIGTVRAQASSDGDKSTLVETSAWIDGLTAGKTFMKLYRVFYKFRKDEQFMALKDSCKCFLQFIKDAKIEAHFSLSLIGYKLQFYNGAANLGGLLASTTSFVEDGFACLLGANTPGGADNVDPEVWFREVFSQAVVIYLCSFSLDEMHDDADKIVEEFSTAMAVVKECSTKFKGILDPVLADMDKLKVILEVGLGAKSTSASCLREALRVCQTSQQLPNIKQYLQNNGSSLLLAATDSLQQRAADDIAATKLVKAVKTLDEDGLISIIPEGQPPHKFTVTNAESAFDLTSVQSCIESTTVFSEGLNFFSSPGQAEAHAALIVNWVKSCRGPSPWWTIVSSSGGLSTPRALFNAWRRPARAPATTRATPSST